MLVATCERRCEAQSAEHEVLVRIACHSGAKRGFLNLIKTVRPNLFRDKLVSGMSTLKRLQKFRPGHPHG